MTEKKVTGRIPVQTLISPVDTAVYRTGNTFAELLPFDGKFQQIPEKHIRNGLIMRKIENTVQIRTRRPGDRIQVQSGEAVIRN